MEGVVERTLPAPLDSLAAEYERVMGTRDRFLWRWFHRVNPHFRLSVVPPAHEGKVQTDKTAVAFLVTLLDDLVDKRHDEATFREAARVPFPGVEPHPDRPGVDPAPVRFAGEIWEHVEARLGARLADSDLEDLFYFDLRQVVNAIEYAALVNGTPAAGNLTEAYAYGSHNMGLFMWVDVDLLHAEGFDRSELGDLRELVSEAQRLARIGNWVSTWRRELREGDVSSGVVGRAVREGVVAPGELPGPSTPPEEVDRLAERVEASGVAEELLVEWAETHARLRREASLSSVDVEAFLDGMATVLEHQLRAEGMK